MQLNSNIMGLKKILYIITISLLLAVIPPKKSMAQSVYTSNYPLSYYNMDTTKITINSDIMHYRTFTYDEIQKIASGELEPNSDLEDNFNDISCVNNGIEILPFANITDTIIYNYIAEIVEKSILCNCSDSPDTLISHGIFFEISISRKQSHSNNSPCSVLICVFSNYYLYSVLENIKEAYPPTNIFACYYKNILGIVAYDEYSTKEAHNLFTKNEQTISLHLFKQRIQILKTKPLSHVDDIYSTSYGLYRRYKMDGGHWIIN